MCIVDGRKDVSDRLSELPEELLLVILSLMPLKSAVATKILSQRWRCVWTRVPDFKLCVDHDFGKYEKSGGCYNYYFWNRYSPSHKQDEFFAIVDNILSKLTSLRTFDLDIGCVENMLFTNKIRNHRHIHDWFTWVCCYNPAIQEFRFRMDSLGPDLPRLARYPDPPLCLFQTTSLVVLKLRPWLCKQQQQQQQQQQQDDYNALLFHLPNLKKLDVELIPWIPRILEKLVSCSPSLEELSFTAYITGKIPIHNSHILNLSSLSLKRLDMDMQLKYAIHVAINTPNLEYLGFDVHPTESLYHFSFVSPPTALLSSSVLWRGCGSYLDRVFLPSNLFTAISNVVSLSTISSKLNPMLSRIRFRRLTHLVLWVCGIPTSLKGLALVQQCPLLEVLTLHLSWSEEPCLLPDFIPQPLVTSLKRVEIVAHSYVRQLEATLLHLLNYLLSNAQALELLRINIKPTTRWRKENGNYDELHLIKVLLEVPRHSQQCKVEFYGLHHTSVVHD